MAKDSFKVKKSLNIEPVASPTMDADGDIAVDSSTNRVKVRTNSTTDNVVTDAGTQTLTNKTLTSPTISSPTLSGTLTTPLTASRAVVTGASSELAAATTTATEIGYVNGVTSAIQTQLDAKVAKTLTTTTGDMIYASSANTPARLAIGSSGQVLKTVGGVPTWATFSGGINYLSSNPDAESDTTGWATYADAAASTPVDGTGGSATATFTRSTSSPLRGTGSFLLSKGATNRQGDGASFDFSIDTADQGKPLSVSFDYYVSSGTYATGDVTVYIYDVTNAALIQPSGYQIVSQTVQASHLGCTFQAASNSTSYRLILHIASTSAVAYDLKFDNFYVGPQQRSYGPAMTDWVAYTPTLNSNTGVSTNTAYWRRNGDSLEVQGTVVYSGAGANSAFSSSLPTGLVIDTSKVPTAASEANPLGAASFFDSGSGAKPAITVYNNTTSIYISHATTGVVNTNTMTASDKLEYTYTVPIVGWSSNTLVSSSASTRVTALLYTNVAGTSFTGGAGFADAPFATKAFDTHGAFSTPTFTAPVPGFYEISFNLF